MKKLVIFLFLLSCSTENQFSARNCDILLASKARCSKIIKLGSCESNLIDPEYCAVLLDNGQMTEIIMPVVEGMRLCSTNGKRWEKSGSSTIEHKREVSICKKIKECINEGIEKYFDCVRVKGI